LRWELKIKKHKGVSKKANPETEWAKKMGSSASKSAATGGFLAGFYAGWAAKKWLDALTNAAKAVMDYVRGKCCAGYEAVKKAAAAAKRAVGHLIGRLFNSNKVADGAEREIDRAAGQAKDISAAPLLELCLPADPEPQALAALKSMADQAAPVRATINQMLSYLTDTNLNDNIPQVAISCIATIMGAAVVSLKVFPYFTEVAIETTIQTITTTAATMAAASGIYSIHTRKRTFSKRFESTSGI